MIQFCQNTEYFIQKTYHFNQNTEFLLKILIILTKILNILIGPFFETCSFKIHFFPLNYILSN
jgi:hypothetical protein